MFKINFLNSFKKKNLAIAGKRFSFSSRLISFHITYNKKSTHSKSEIAMCDFFFLICLVDFVMIIRPIYFEHFYLLRLNFICMIERQKKKRKKLQINIRATSTTTPLLLC